MTFYEEWYVYDRAENEIELEVEYEYSPPTPDRPYLRNGDPGYPGDPAEIEIVNIYRNSKVVPEGRWNEIGFNRIEQEKFCNYISENPPEPEVPEPDE